MDNKKYYWLKLNKNFFKRHDIKIIEDMDNGKDYILFYLKLLCESVDHNGELRFSETIPYNEKMLSTITNTNIDIVRSAMKVFTELNMMEILDNGTLFMNELNKMLGSESVWAEKKRIYRDKKRTLSYDCPTNVLQEKDKEKDIDIYKEEINKEESERTHTKKFIKPTLKEVEDYCKERNNNVEPCVFIDFYESKGWKVGNQPMKDWRACIRTWEKKPQFNKKTENSYSQRKYSAEELDKLFDDMENIEI